MIARTYRAALWLVGSLALCQPARGQGPTEVASAVAPDSEGAIRPDTLRVWNRTIAVFRAPFGTITPRQRVANARARIDAIHPEAQGHVESEPVTLGAAQGVLITVDSRPVFGLLPGDVDLLDGESLEEITESAVAQLQDALHARWEQKDPTSISRSLARLIAATLVFGVILWLVRRFLRTVTARLERAERVKHATVLEVDVTHLAVASGRLGFRLVAWALILLATYVWLTYDFAQFPYSRPWAFALNVWLRRALMQVAGGIISALPGLAMVAIILFLTRAATRVAVAAFDRAENGVIHIPGVHPETARASRRLVVVLLWLFSATVAYPYIPGSDTAAFKGISLFAGLMLSLGSAGLLNQIVSGFVATYSRAMAPGEYVRVGEVEGTVTELGVLCTKIRTPKNESVAIPNAVVVNTPTTNYSRLAGADGSRLSTSVTIGYDAPWRQVQALLLRAAAVTPGVRTEPAPFIMQRALADFFVEYSLWFNIDRPEQRLWVLSDLHAQIQDAFNESGVQIMSPHFMTQPDRAVLAPEGVWGTPRRVAAETQQG